MKEIADSLAYRRDIIASYLLLFITLVLASVFFADALRVYVEGEADSVAVLLYAFCGGLLIFSAVAHLLARLGYQLRLRFEAPPPRSAAAADVDVGILVPSYREEADVIHRTLLSAALQTHRRKWITLLLDDPQVPATPEHRTLLEGGRTAPARVAAFLAPLLALARAAAGSDDPRNALRSLHATCARYLTDAADRWPSDDHENRLFRERVLRARADLHLDRADRLAEEPAGPERARREIAELIELYAPMVRSFERKRYQNLSHAPNKAMNLNTYIGLLGRRLAEESRPEGRYLVSHAAAEAFPTASYLVTLDADSILLPEYVEVLAGIMEAPGQDRVAVVQTPYAATPGAASPLERIAGATTDVQRLLHQGCTRFDGTFWVGANAVLRVEALQDIRQPFTERGHRLYRYIQDRTVIEDTESTIDLIRRGWTLWNHPEALAYSATPSDFGALAIQRRRWACGGLLVLPKAMRALLGRGTRSRLPQAVIRLHYLGSLAWVPAALIVLVACPVGDAVNS
jgi:cellulose synthase/poly-beta-1,6-N-acetylglucosamine synthase-like glycosyltransferase